jgi:D-alanyl-D-alanine carboxypeptidase
VFVRASFVVVWAIALSMGAAAVARSASADEAGPRLNEILDSAISWKLTPGVSLAVVNHGKIVYAGARGSADLENQRPASIETRYPIGSLGALFIAVAAVQLDAAGKLRLDDSLSRYFPPGQSLGIALRQLLPPREDDDNSEALAAVVERVSGEPLVTYLTDHIFRPAGMTQTWFGEPPEWLPLATGYSEWNDEFQAVQPETDAWSRKCCSFVSTATDLARFDVALFNGRLIPAASFRSLKPAFLSAQKGGKSMIGRMGTPAGYDAETALFMDEHFAIVTLANCSGFAAPPVLDRVLGVYYPEIGAASTSADRQLDANAGVTARLRDLLAKQYESTGAVRSMTFLSSSTSAGSTEYRYLVDVNGETKTAFLLIDANGNVSGFWLHGAEP